MRTTSKNEWKHEGSKTKLKSEQKQYQIERILCLFACAERQVKIFIVYDNWMSHRLIPASAHILNIYIVCVCVYKYTQRYVCEYHHVESLSRVGTMNYVVRRYESILNTVTEKQNPYKIKTNNSDSRNLHRMLLAFFFSFSISNQIYPRAYSQFCLHSVWKYALALPWNRSNRLWVKQCYLAFWRIQYFLGIYLANKLPVPKT